jgi:hypothetical protein
VNLLGGANIENVVTVVREFYGQNLIVVSEVDDVNAFRTHEDFITRNLAESQIFCLTRAIDA